MGYFAGQPVRSVMDRESAFLQEFGPHMGEPVVRGIVHFVYSEDCFSVFWEYMDWPVFCSPDDVEVV